MALKVKVDGVERPDLFQGSSKGVPYSVRIGTGNKNDIVIRSEASGVHDHHCTVTCSGEIYKLEMAPSHVVYVNGKLVRDGDQLFVGRKAEKCELSLGGYSPPEEKVFDPPPRVELRKEEDHYPKPPFKWLAAGVVAALALVFGLKTWMDSDRAAQTERQISAMKASFPALSDTVRAKAQSAVLQIGLVKDGKFTGLGTTWVWQVQKEDIEKQDVTKEEIEKENAGKNKDQSKGEEKEKEIPAGRRLVTNRHVTEAINDCARAQAADASACRGAQGGCPAIRYDDLKVVEIVDCSKDPHVLTPKFHPHFEEFASRLGEGKRSAEVPNVYDIAVIDWPDALKDWKAEGLRIFLEPDTASKERRTQPGDYVGAYGVPSENQANAPPTPIYRAGNIGRMSDPFGLPSTKHDYLVITGGAVEGGDSGGPIVNSAGKVVGMKFSGFFVAGAAGQDIARLDYGDKYNALHARLIGEVIGLPAMTETARTIVTRKRILSWNRGLASMVGDYLDRVLIQHASDSCAGAKVAPEKIDTFQLSSSHELNEADRKSAPGGIPWAWGDAGEFTADMDAGPNATPSQAFVLVARGLGDASVEPVFLRMTREGTQRLLSSNDAFATVATVKDDVLFTGGATQMKYSYVIYSPKKANFDVQVYRIACPKPGAPQ